MGRDSDDVRETPDAGVIQLLTNGGVPFHLFGVSTPPSPGGGVVLIFPSITFIRSQ